MKLPQSTLLILGALLCLHCKDSFVNTKNSATPTKSKPVAPKNLDSLPIEDKPNKKTKPKTKGLDTLKPRMAALRNYKA